MRIEFHKYQGTGNDFIMIDDRENLFPADNNQLVAKLCDRKFGIGADGLILLQLDKTDSLFMKYYNADGNESSMCGNGGRCFAAFSCDLGLFSEKIKFTAIDGPHEALIGPLENNMRYVKLKMKSVKEIDKRSRQTFVLNTGSPHYVQYEEGNLNELDLNHEAKKIRYNDEFAAAGINVNFITKMNDTALGIRTYERGVEDETLSCGTGVTAAAISHALHQQLPSGHYIISVKAMGGDLKVSYDYDKELHSFQNIWLQGMSTFVFQGSIEIV